MHTTLSTVPLDQLQATAAALAPLAKVPQRCIIDNLRKVADWLERHDVAPEEMIFGKADKWTAEVLLYLPAARKLWPNKLVEFKDGLATFHEDGMRITVCLEKETESEEVVL